MGEKLGKGGATVVIKMEAVSSSIHLNRTEHTQLFLGRQAMHQSPASVQGEVLASERQHVALPRASVRSEESV